MLCKLCYATGHVETICAVCNGSGEGSRDGQICFDCMGFGTIDVKCRACDGTGEIEPQSEEITE